MYRRPLSALMTVALAAGLSPMSAFAAEVDEFDYHVSPQFYNPVPLSDQEQAFIDAIRDNPDYYLDLNNPIYYSLSSTKFGYVWPLPEGGLITQHFGNAGHTGVDIGIAQGSPVVSCMDGYVKYVQTWDGASRGGMQSYGNLVIVYHPSTGHSTYYAHLDKIAVRAGQNVTKGQLIGRVGTTGNSTGYHLHIEMHVNASSGIGTYGSGDGIQVDPLRFIDRNYMGPFGDEPIEMLAASKAKSAQEQKDKAAEAEAKAKAEREAKAASNATAASILSEGVYCLVPAVAADKAIDATLCEANGAALSVGNRMQTTSQLFAISACGDGSCRIENLQTGKAITALPTDSDNPNRTEGASAVTQAEWNGETAQRWKVVDNGHGWYSFRNCETDLYLDVADAATENGTYLQQYESTGAAAQKFSLVLWDTSLTSDRVVVHGIKSSYDYHADEVVPSPYVLRLLNAHDEIDVSSAVGQAPRKAETSTLSIAEVAEELAFQKDDSSALDAANRNAPVATNAGTPLAYVTPTRTYQVELDSSELADGEASTLRLRALDSNGLDIVPAQEIDVTSERQTIVVRPSRACTLYLESVGASGVDGGTIEAHGVRVYEVLKNNFDYRMRSRTNVDAGMGSTTLTGIGAYTDEV